MPKSSLTQLIVKVFIPISLTCTTISAGYWISVDEHDRPLPGLDSKTDWNYNATGGNRGILNDADINYDWTGESIEISVVSGTWGGMWYVLNHDKKDGVNYDFNAIFGDIINPILQGKIVGIEVKIDSVVSPGNNTSLSLKMELKRDLNGFEDLVWDSAKILPLNNDPQSIFFDLTPESLNQVQMVALVIENAIAMDKISIDYIRFKVEIPQDLPTADQAFLWSFSWLYNNFDKQSYMIQDRSNFEFGAMENVTATAKFAKCAWYAYVKGFISFENAADIISGIAKTFIQTLPRGPEGINTLWPHFTEKGGTQILEDPNAEWPSGDASYAALDIITAVQAIGDPNSQLGGLIQFLEDINWADMLNNENKMSHGYYNNNGQLIPYYWEGFGMENLGLNWAYASATGNTVFMSTAPTDNGSGFISHCNYPIVMLGYDKWGNNWDEYRHNEAVFQINWYSQESSENTYLASANLFGLSAAENPDFPIPAGEPEYIAYGTGGKFGGPQTGNDEIIVLHYSGMVSDVALEESQEMWISLRDRTEPFLSDNLVISPWNSMESMRVNKTTGHLTINRLKGGWNLALLTEGWAMADSNIKKSLWNAIQSNSFLYTGYQKISLQPPRIQISPMDTTVNEGDNLTFSVNSSGLYLGYQWQKNGTNISNATDSVYTIISPSLADSGNKYRVIVSNPTGQDTSENATLIVMPIQKVPSTPIILIPIEKADEVSLSPLIMWTKSENANSYEVRVMFNCDTATIVGDNLLSDTSFVLQETLENQQNYCIQVRSGNGAGFSEWSDFRKFCTTHSVVKVNLSDIPKTLDVSFSGLTSASAELLIPTSGMVLFEVWGLDGKSLYKFQNHLNPGMYQLLLPNLPEGLKVVRLVQNKRQIVKKIIKSNE